MYTYVYTYPCVQFNHDGVLVGVYLFIYIYLHTNIDLSGDIGPFQVAIALTVVTLGLILPWRENYGHGKSDSTVSSTSTGGSSGASGSQSFIAWVKETGTLLRSQPVILYLGLSQAFFEGAIYTFGKCLCIAITCVFSFYCHSVLYHMFYTHTNLFMYTLYLNIL